MFWCTYKSLYVVSNIIMGAIMLIKGTLVALKAIDCVDLAFGFCVNVSVCLVPGVMHPRCSSVV